MQQDNKKIAAAFILPLLVVGLVLLGFNIYKNSRFHLSESVPKTTGSVSTSFQQFNLAFSKDLDLSVDYMKKIEDPGKNITSVKVSKTSLKLLIKPLKQNTHYDFKLLDIKAKDGEVIRGVKFSFTAKYVPYNKLSKQEQAALAQQTSNTAPADPILAHLPHSTLTYSLYASTNGDESSQAGPLVLIAQIFISNADQKIDREGAINTYKQQAQDYIKSLGLDPAKYTISYQIMEQ